MHRRVPSLALAFLLLGALATLAGCKRASEEAAVPVVADRRCDGVHQPGARCVGTLRDLLAPSHLQITADHDDLLHGG